MDFLSISGLNTYDVKIKEYIQAKQAFVGSLEEYEEANANGLIPNGSVVIITDDYSEKIETE